MSIATRHNETRLSFQLDVCCLFQQLQRRHRPGPTPPIDVVHVSCIRTIEITILQQLLRTPALPFLPAACIQANSSRAPSITKAASRCPVWRLGTEIAWPTRSKESIPSLQPPPSPQPL